MAEVVRQGDGFGQVFVEAEAARDGAADLGDFQGMREAGAVMVVGLGDEDLRLVHQPAKRGGVDDAIAVALVEGAKRMGRFGMTPAAALARAHGIGGQRFIFSVEPVGRLERRFVRGHGELSGIAACGYNLRSQTLFGNEVYAANITASIVPSTVHTTRQAIGR